MRSRASVCFKFKNLSVSFFFHLCPLFPLFPKPERGHRVLRWHHRVPITRAHLRAGNTGKRSPGLGRRRLPVGTRGHTLVADSQPVCRGPDHPAPSAVSLGYQVPFVCLLFSIISYSSLIHTHTHTLFTDKILTKALDFSEYPFAQQLCGCIRMKREFPGGSAGKESPCNSGDPGSIPGSGRSPGEGIGYPLQYSWASFVAQLVKSPPAIRETWVRSLGWEDPLEKRKAAHSSILAWRIPWTV